MPVKSKQQIKERLNNFFSVCQNQMDENFPHTINIKKFIHYFKNARLCKKKCDLLFIKSSSFCKIFFTLILFHLTAEAIVGH